MRALAEFIMRGRLQAGSVAVLGYLIPLLAPVTVAFVTLRKGAVEGTLILLLGVIPAILSLMFGESGSIAVWITLLSLLSVYIPALVLRFTISLQAAILSAVAVAAVLSGLVISLAPGAVEQLTVALTALFTPPSDGVESPVERVLNTADVAGLIAYTLSLNSILGVLLGRWFQSLVFNPGGFGAEFRELRLHYVVTALCFLGAVWIAFSTDGFGRWANVLAMPLLLVTLAIGHHFVKAKSIAMPWLVLFYIVMFNLVHLAVIIGLLDIALNFRNRWQQKP
jgi:hypothetical protein